MENFIIKPAIYFGDDALSALLNYQGKRVLIVADPFIAKSGMLDKITAYLNGCEIEIFSHIVPDPPIENVAEGVCVFESFRPQLLVAVGGGSAIDAAKAIRFFAKNTEVCPLAAIPTTSGTGSEVTKFSVVTDASTGRKYPLVNEGILPDVAILEKEFVKSVPRVVAADTGMDVLTHAVEAYVSVEANVFSDAMAEKAVSYVFEYLERSVNGDYDMEAKEKMHEASALAGLAFNAVSLGLNHAIAHNLGGRLSLPHGRVNAVLLVPVIMYNADLGGYEQRNYSKAAHKYARLGILAGSTSTNVRGQIKTLTERIKRLMERLHMPKSFKECGISEETLRRVENAAAQGALLDGCMRTNPRAADKDEIIQIIRESGVGKRW